MAEPQWIDIAAAGGIREWVDAEVGKQGLTDPGVPASDGEKKAYKARRDEERRETVLYLDGNKVRMDSTETYSSPDAAKKAHERLKKMLAGEGYKE
ncbi:MAG TPA: hypothetical protein VH143_11750 [Kofleriaceae bacterium]|nr:hypothetical protein [Kofleriaceae bacterium]